MKRTILNLFRNKLNKVPSLQPISKTFFDLRFFKYLFELLTRSLIPSTTSLVFDDL